MDRIKRLSTEIMDEYQDKLGTDFVTNKQFLNEVSIIRSKALKNKIAGYITKIIQRKQKFEEQKQQLIENDKKIVQNESEPVEESAPEPVEESAPAQTLAEEILSDDNSTKTP